MINNKGLGAGGKNTNESGIPFENKTKSCIFEFLKNKKQFELSKYGLFRIFDNVKVIFCEKRCFEYAMKDLLGYKSIRKADEVLFILSYPENKVKKMVIIEKKNQNVSGSVDLKLWSGPSLLDEYYYDSKNNNVDINIDYCFIFNDYFFKPEMLDVKNSLRNYKHLSNSQKRFRFLQNQLNERNIHIMNGSDENYIYHYYEVLIKSNVFDEYKYEKNEFKMSLKRESEKIHYVLFNNDYGKLLARNETHYLIYMLKTHKKFICSKDLVKII
jgi:hypothetical protein